jgi:hypothetical protein
LEARLYEASDKLRRAHENAVVNGNARKALQYSLRQSMAPLNKALLTWSAAIGRRRWRSRKHKLQRCRQPNSICSRFAKQNLFRNSAKEGLVIEACIWSKDRKLLDLAGSLTKRVPLLAVQSVLSSIHMAVVDTGSILKKNIPVTLSHLAPRR